MDGSPELLFLDEGSSGRSTKRDRSSSSVTNSSMATSEPGLSGSVSQSDLDTPHIATHERSGSESTAKTDDDNMKGYNNNNNNNGSSSSSSSGRHLGSDTGSSWDSERVGDADGMVPNAMPSGPSTDMSTRIRRRKSEIPEHTAVRSTSSASNGAGSVTQCVNGIEGVRARRGRPKRIIEEDQSSALPTPPITDYLNDYSTSAHIGNHHENKGRNRVEDGTHYPSFSSRTAPADATATSGMYYENNITAELLCPLDSESLMDSAKDYTINLPSSLPTTSGVTLLKILKKRKMRNLNLLTESSVPLSDLTPIDAAFRQPHGEQGTDPL